MGGAGGGRRATVCPLRARGDHFPRDPPRTPSLHREGLSLLPPLWSLAVAPVLHSAAHRPASVADSHSRSATAAAAAAPAACSHGWGRLAGGAAAASHHHAAAAAAAAARLAPLVPAPPALRDSQRRARRSSPSL